MADAEADDVVEVEDLLACFRPLLLACARADRELRERGHNNVLTRIRGQFALVLRQSHRKIHFGWIKGASTIYTAQASLDFALRAALSWPPEPAPRCVRALPSLVEPGREAGRYTLRLTDGRIVEFDAGGLAGAPCARDYFALLEVFARRLEGAERRYRTLAEEPREPVLRELLQGLRSLLQAYRGEQERDDPGSPWAFEHLRLGVRARVDDDGKIADPREDPEALTYRLATHVHLAGAATLVIDQEPGDLRRDAADVEPFLAKLRKEGLAPLRRALRRHLADGIKASDVKKFLDPKRLDFVVVMTRRDRETEALICAVGPLAGRRAHVALTIPCEDAARRLRPTELVVEGATYEFLDDGGNVSDNAWRYVNDVLATLARWSSEGEPE